MKKILRKNAVFLLFVFVISGMVTGCAASFDASRYIKACLDANTHGEFADYAEITKVSVEEIESQYNSLMDSELSYLAVYNLDDDKLESFRQLFIDIYKNCKYEVGEAVKNDDKTYSVPVTTYKLQIFKNFAADAEDYLTEYVQKEIDAGNTLSEEDLYLIIADYMYDYLSANLEALEYAEPETITVSVGPEGSNSNVYSISTTDLQTLLQSLIDIENAQ